MFVIQNLDLWNIINDMIWKRDPGRTLKGSFFRILKR
jgi:hypothetical protein